MKQELVTRLEAITNNQEFLDLLLPPLGNIIRMDSHKVIKVIVYGAETMGKTQTVEWIGTKAIEKYEKKNVNLVRTEANITKLIESGLSKKPIQLLFADDLTLVKIRDEELINFYRLRHQWQRQFGRTNGLLIEFLSIHSFYTLPKHLRTYFNVLLICNSPINRHDKNLFKSYFGEDLLGIISTLDYFKLREDKWKRYKAYWILGTVGLIDTSIVEPVFKTIWTYDEEAKLKRVRRALDQLRKDLRYFPRPSLRFYGV